MAGEKKLNFAENAENRQPSYEELKNYCDQLMIQRNRLNQELQQITNILNKLPWLFEVVKTQESFDKEFVQRCIEEIQEIMTPPENLENQRPQQDKDGE